MNPMAFLFTTLAVLAGAVLFVFLIIYLIVPLFKAIGWLIRHVFRFVAGVVTDLCRFVGSVLLAILYIPMMLGTIVIGRWSASGHYGRAFLNEGSSAGLALYRVAIGHPARLLGLGGLVEGVEHRLPAVMAGAPTADLPTPRTGKFEGYRITGSLAPGGSGAKLYIAEPDSVKQRQFAKAGFSEVDQLVIKSFSLRDGSSLPQIVRESRSLDAAKKLGLIFDHELTQERFYYVMRYVPGEPLSAVCRNLHAGSATGGLGDAQLRSAISYVADLVSTLDVYHRGGLWHKDVKPDNVIIDGDGRAHLVDFGLVSSLRSAMTLTTHGTEYFRDPEMVRLALKGVKVHEVDGTKFDIFGAGAVLYSVMEDSFPAHGVLSQVTRRCPEAVKWIIRRAMTDYDKRYPSAGAMLADLTTVLNSRDPFAVRPADLPSMRGAFGPVSGEEPVHAAVLRPEPMVAGAAASPTPPPLNGGPNAGSLTRTAPVIEVTGWLSGKSRVVGAKSHGPVSPEQTGRAARQWAEHGVAAAKGVWAGFVGGAAAGAANGAAAQPVAQHAAYTPPPPPGVRRPAAEQLAAARSRVESRRAKTRAWRGKAIGARTEGKSGWNGGVAVALLVFVGAMVGLTLTFTTQRPERSVVVNSGEVDVNEVASAALSEPLPEVGGKAIIVSDLGSPLSEGAVDRLTRVLAELDACGVSTRGVIAGVSDTGDEGIIDLLATLRTSLGLTPLDDPSAAARVSEWMNSHRDDADIVVWLAPDPDKQSDAPRIYVFGPDDNHDEADTERFVVVRTAMDRAVLQR